MTIKTSQLLDILKSGPAQKADPFKQTLFMDDGSLQDGFSDDIINHTYKKLRSTYPKSPHENQEREKNK